MARDSDPLQFVRPHVCLLEFLHYFDLPQLVGQPGSFLIRFVSLQIQILDGLAAFT